MIVQVSNFSSALVEFIDLEGNPQEEAGMYNIAIAIFSLHYVLVLLASISSVFFLT